MAGFLLGPEYRTPLARSPPAPAACAAQHAWQPFREASGLGSVLRAPRAYLGAGSAPVILAVAIEAGYAALGGQHAEQVAKAGRTACHSTPVRSCLAVYAKYCCQTTVALHLIRYRTAGRFRPKAEVRFGTSITAFATIAADHINISRFIGITAISFLSFFYAMCIRIVSVIHDLSIYQHVGCCFNDVKWGNEPFTR